MPVVDLAVAGEVGGEWSLKVDEGLVAVGRRVHDGEAMEAEKETVDVLPDPGVLIGATRADLAEVLLHLLHITTRQGLQNRCPDSAHPLCPLLLLILQMQMLANTYESHWGRRTERAGTLWEGNRSLNSLQN